VILVAFDDQAEIGEQDKPVVLNAGTAETLAILFVPFGIVT